ncbi:MAG: hypothetical protein AAF202_08185, partial [Pseudomonadota bacterium]
MGKTQRGLKDCMGHFGRLFVGALLSCALGVNSSYAAMEFIPESDSPEDYQEMVRRIAEILPGSQYNSTSMIERQFTLLRDLRDSIPNYDQLAAEKPGPFTVEIQKAGTKTENVPSIIEDQMSTFVERVNSVHSFAELQSSVESGDQQTLVATLIELLIEDINEASQRPRGIITGIANTQESKTKKALFSAGRLEDQIAFLKSGEINEEALLEGFDPDRLGFESKKISLKFLIEQL